MMIIGIKVPNEISMEYLHPLVILSAGGNRINMAAITETVIPNRFGLSNIKIPENKPIMK